MNPHPVIAHLWAHSVLSAQQYDELRGAECASDCKKAHYLLRLVRHWCQYLVALKKALNETSQERIAKLF